LSSNDGAAFGGGPPGAPSKPMHGDLPLLFGIVTFACLLAALTLSAYGHRPALMLPIALACAVVFVRHGDGRQHWTPASATEQKRRDRRRSDRPGTDARLVRVQRGRRVSGQSERSD